MAKICSILNRTAKSLTINSYQRGLKERMIVVKNKWQKMM
jgi:hypothetical protein